MMVDPLEAVIKLAQADSGLNTITGGRIAQRHHYGQDAGEWALDAASLVFRPVGGPPQLSVCAWQIQAEAWCYADTPFLCGQVSRRLRAWCRAVNKAAIAVIEGDALVYWVVARSEPRLMMDGDVRPNGMPAYVMLLEASVAEETV